MLNKNSLLAAVVTVVVVCSAVFFMKAGSKQDTLFAENVEALAQDEGYAVITCAAGNCGRCFEEKTAWPCYRCNWTGRQADYCECDKIGWFFYP